MQASWWNGKLVFESENDKEGEFLIQFTKLLQTGQLTFKPSPDPTTLHNCDDE